MIHKEVHAHAQESVFALRNAVAPSLPGALPHSNFYNIRYFCLGVDNGIILSDLIEIVTLKKYFGPIMPGIEADCRKPSPYMGVLASRVIGTAPGCYVKYFQPE